MAKAKVLYLCRECGGQAAKWSGQCPHCLEWNTLEESVAEVVAGTGKNRFSSLAASGKLQQLADVEANEGARTSSGIAEFDRVLGGDGLVKGCVILMGGEPGIGKSTILLQVLAHLSQENKVLYVSGEESAQQIALRAKRLSLDASSINLLPEIQLEKIQTTIAKENPQFVVIDSIQTVYSEQLTSAPGSVSQVRECAAQLTRVAKSSDVTMILVGHVTKEGALAGPRVLEHIVDTVLYFEGDTHSQHRVIRAVKNRFGAVNEIAVFAMMDNGLREVSNPSALFLSHHSAQVAGTCVVVTQEGTRPMLVEIQALLDTAHSPSPRRLALGLESNRLAMLLAVMHRHAGIACYDQDVFINAVGGVKITEPGADLAVMLAMVSSLVNKPLPEKLVVFGEVGLAGEVRPVQRGQERLKEAAKLGFTSAIIPTANMPKHKIAGMEIIAVDRVEEAVLHWRDRT
jgi:DNA repair protein RadA/Sms